MIIVEKEDKAIEYLVEFLRPYEKFDELLIHLTRVDDYFIHGVWDLLYTHDYYLHVIRSRYTVQSLSRDSVGTLRYYLDDTTNPNYWKYYRRKDFVEGGETVTKYRREDTYVSNTYEVLPPEVPLRLFDLEDYFLTGRRKLYFENSTNAMYLRTQPPVEIRLGISYNSENFFLPNNHTTRMDFTDASGWGDSNWDGFWKQITHGALSSFIDEQDRKLHLMYSPGSGTIQLYPQLIRGTDHFPYRLLFPFLDGNLDFKKLRYNSGKFFPLRNALDAEMKSNAILLNFKTVYGLFAFTKMVYFENSRSISTDHNDPTISQFFISYSELVKDTYRELKNKKNGLFKLFFFLPDAALKLIDAIDLWAFVTDATQTALTNNYTDKEDIVVKILETLSTMYQKPTVFLDEFMNRRVDKIPLLEHLTYRLDGYNFDKLVKLIRGVWKKSIYSSLEETNPVLNLNGQSPILLNYKSDKTIGFHHDNATIKWTDDYNKIKVIFYESILKENEEYNFLEESLVTTINFFTPEIEATSYTYHPYAPLAILSEDNPEFIFKDEAQEGGVFQIMPAYILFAREQRAFWSNLATAGEYVADVLSFLSGYGNILKAGKLFKAFKLGEKIILKSKAFTTVAIGFRRASGFIEITAGVGNALLKLTGKRDTEWGQKISQVLFYLEMAALAGEVTAALHGSIKKASLEALENTAEVNKIIKQAQETILKNTDAAGNPRRIEDVLKAQDDLAAIKQLEEFAGVAENIGGSGFRVLSKKSDDFGNNPKVQLIENKIRTEKHEFLIILDDNGNSITDLITDGVNQSVRIPYWLSDKIKRFKYKVLTHNHPNSTSLSFQDFDTFITLQLNELRAVCKNGDTFLITKKTEFPEDFYKQWRTNVITKLRNHPDTQGLYLSAKNGDKIADNKLAMLQSDFAYEEMKMYVDYIKFE